MFKQISQNVWAFDVEWVPDSHVGRRLFQLPNEMEEAEVFQKMWEAGGASEEDPMPYLKTILCRVVSIAAVIRKQKDDQSVSLSLTSLPHHPEIPQEQQEAAILSTYLNAIGEKKPQLVGFNSQRSDLKILVQRAVAQGIQAKEFAKRPNKPWEGVDYFDSKFSPVHVDLIEILGGRGKSTPSLHEMAHVCRIPGKMGVEGKEVAPLWLEGRLPEILAYNECDALSTYLIWLRTAHFGGFFSNQTYEEEQLRVRELLEREGASPGKEYLLDFLEEWEQLQTV